MPDLRIHLFGQFQVLVAGQPVPNNEWRGQMPRTLLQYLAARPDAQSTSEELMDALWSHLPAERARPNLQETVRRLRAILAAHAGGVATTLLPYTGTGYRLPDGAWTDLGALHQQVREVRRLQAQDPEAALARLEQTELPASDAVLIEQPYADWAIAARERAHQDTMALRLLHGDLLLRAGRARAALDCLRTVLEMEPVRESTAQLAIQIAVDLGDRVAALDIFDRCRRALAEDLGVDPMPETLAVYTRVLQADTGVNTAAAALLPGESHTAPAALLPGESHTAPATLLPGDSHTAAQPATNLPAQPTRFIGRQAEMAAVSARFPGTRLLTLTGAGGSGKTRLALQVAADMLPVRANGVWLVELAALTDPLLVPAVVAATLGLHEHPRRTPLELLVEHVKSTQMLLVLDNCEHLVDACAALADTLLRSGADLWILATSREALRIPGESLYPVPPLRVPVRTQLPAVDRLREFDAIALFLDRAAAMAQGFTVTAENAPAIVRICRTLDGMPLAIELAAALVRLLSLDEIDDRLHERFRLLTAGSRTAPPRQKTLRGAVDWSHELLPEPERVLWRKLSVFAGGFTLAAAEAVCAQADLPPDEVLAVLHRLVDKSLVIADEQGGERRFRMLETIREYGLEKLRAAGEEPGVRARHYDWCLALAQAVAAEQWGPKWAAGYDRLEREHDNQRAALEWCRGSTGGAAKGIRLAWTLVHFWDTWGHVQEGRQRAAELLALPEVPPDPPVHALGLTLSGYLAICHGDYGSAARSAEAGLAIWRGLGDKLGQAHCLLVLGMAAHHGDTLEGAVPLMEESLTLFRAVDYRPFVRLALFHLGDALTSQGDYRRARAHHEESLALKRATDDRTLPFSLLRLAYLATMDGDLPRAVALARESSPLWEPRFIRGLAGSLEVMAAVASAAGQADRAVCMVGAADSIRRFSGLGAGTDVVAWRELLLAQAASRLGPEAFAAAWSHGQSLSPEQATAYALSDPSAGE
ncbi:MAG: hypothetical protein JWN15_1554 [Firmicutes bacterium]|nr:hypothetical protein [Bacillota bacterium]